MTDGKMSYLPALRCRMGDWIYYVTALRMDEIASRVKPAAEVHTSSTLNELIQRELTGRSGTIAAYLISQPQRFFNSIIVAVYEGSPEWLDIEIFSTELLAIETVPEESESRISNTLGLLRLSGAEKLFALDGQHRVEAIKQALKYDPELAQEEVSVIFVSHDPSSDGLVRTRRLFSTLNRYAKPVSKGEIVALDEDDAFAIVTRLLLDEHPLLKGGRISLSKQAAIPRSDKKVFTTILTIYDMVMSLFVDRHQEGVKWTNRFLTNKRPSQDIIDLIYRESFLFFDLLAENFEQVRKVQENPAESNVAGEFRTLYGGHMLFRPVGLMAFARAIRKLRDQDIDMSEAFFDLSGLQYELSQAPWPGVLWNPVRQTMIAGTTARNLAADLLLFYAGLPTDIGVLLSEYRKVVRDPDAELPIE